MGKILSGYSFTGRQGIVEFRWDMDMVVMEADNEFLTRISLILFLLIICFLSGGKNV